jgi:hypothetical protein
MAEPDPATLARFRELLLDTLHRHLASSDALDAKAWQALGVGSIVLGLGVAGDLKGWGLGFPLIGYVALAGGAYNCIRIREWKVTPEGDELWRDAWNVTAPDVDHTIVNALTEAEPHNRALLVTKAHSVRWALAGLAAEIGALVLVAMFR